MDPDEQWINAYYFWKLQYEVRHRISSDLEEAKTIVKEIRTCATDVDCKLLLDTVESINIPDCIYYKALSISGFPCNYYASKCVSCQRRDKVISLSHEFNDLNRIDSISERYRFEPYQLILNSSKFIRDILVILDNHSNTMDNVYKHFLFNSPVRKKFDNTAIELLGFNDIGLVEDGGLIGKAILQVDMSYSLTELVNKLKALWKLRYSRQPIYEDIAKDFEAIKENFKYSKSDIEDRYDPDFRLDSFGTRVLGLFCYDMIQTGVFKNFRELYTSRENGTWDQYIANNIKAQNNIDILTQEEFTMFLDHIGKSASEYRSLIRYFNDAKSSIESGEVLKDKKPDTSST